VQCSAMCRHVQTAASLADAARLMDWVLGKMQ
jgi:hypothetical protein